MAKSLFASGQRLQPDIVELRENVLPDGPVEHSARMAEIARACWPDGADRWTPAMIETLLASDNAFAVCRPDGFALLRVSGEEAELLSLDVLPEARRRGLGSEILREALHEAQARGACEVYLEVDTENAAALALYDRAGFVTRGTRKRYYRKPDGTWGDALVMARFFGSDDTDRAQRAERSDS
ncbi:MAG: ribosomal-protein-alanine N-acetyltransferase [Rhodobacteraceae bacterium HLUCCO18]|nr:MAG: ribosomal-protein-alanine N-acetyltransferase [Rhodobacteraceae bacterium HLUCCO18]